MGHRHLPNSINTFEMEHGHNQNPLTAGHNQNRLTAGQSYIHMGRTIAPGNGSVVHPVDHVLRGGVQCPSQWNSENRANDFPPSSLSTEVSYFRPAFSGPTYDAFPQSSAAGNLYPNPDYSSYYNGHPISEIEGRIGPVIDPSRGPFKRKGPSFSVAYERGSSSQCISEGSSSGSFEPLPGKSPSNYQNTPLVPIGLPHHRDGSLSFSGENSSRNVRSRTRLDLGACPMRTHLSRFSSHHYHSTMLPGAVNLTNMNVDETVRGWNFVPPPPAVHDAHGRTHMRNQYFASGTATEIGPSHNDSVRSRNTFSSSQYFHRPPVQTAREGHNNYSQRAISSSRAGLSYTRLGHEAAYSENGLNSSTETYSSRYCVGGSHNSSRNGRSRVDIERFQSISCMVDSHDRMGPEALVMVDHASSYAGSRNLFDQYGDMRLDIDNMSYEELLDLGERIGNVNMGLSEDMIIKCLAGKIYYSADPIHEEGTCAICLEEYKNEDEVGIVKNCRHDYHVGCIRKWLSMKNACPICKAPALEDSSKEE